MNKYEFLNEPLVLSIGGVLTKRVVPESSSSSSRSRAAAAAAVSNGKDAANLQNGDDSEADADPAAANHMEVDDWDSGDLAVIGNPYMARALDVLYFSIALDPRTIHPTTVEIVKLFKPAMAHQIFGTDEIINGYRNLEIKLVLLANSFHAKINVRFDEVRNDPARGEVADDIAIKFSEWFPELLDSEQFLQYERIEDYQLMYGETVCLFQRIDESGTTMVRINRCDAADPEFAQFHKRFQSLIVFYIDAASIIDTDDPNWRYFYMYQEIRFEDGTAGQIPIGFCTVYMFGISERARIAQLFVLPNYQKKGYGTKLLAAVYRYIDDVPLVKSITVESPCDEFTIMRDKLDLRLVLNEAPFVRDQIVDSCFKPAMEALCREKYKICALQARRLYRILLCYYSNATAAAAAPDAAGPSSSAAAIASPYYRYIIYVKRDLYLNYKRQYARINASTDFEKVLKVKRTLKDSIVFGKRLHKDYKRFLRTIEPQFKYIAKLLNKQPPAVKIEPLPTAMDEDRPLH